MNVQCVCILKALCCLRNEIKTNIRGCLKEVETIYNNYFLSAVVYEHQNPRGLLILRNKDVDLGIKGECDRNYFLGIICKYTM